MRYSSASKCVSDNGRDRDRKEYENEVNRKRIEHRLSEHEDQVHEASPMKVAIVGSRGYRNLGAVRNYVNWLPQGTIIVSGGARGVDKTAEEAAKERGLPQPIIFLPDWKGPHGKRAGYVRNVDIVKAADRVVAFWDMESRGTAHSIALAVVLNKQVEVFTEPIAPS